MPLSPLWPTLLVGRFWLVWLEAAGLIVRRVEGTKRPCSLNQEGMQAVEAWMSQQRATWENRLDRMESYVNQLKQKEQKDAKRKRDT